MLLKYLPLSFFYLISLSAFSREPLHESDESRGKDTDVREQGIEAIEELKTRDLEIKNLIGALKDQKNTRQIRWESAEALGKLRAKNPEAIKVLVEFLKDKYDVLVRIYSARALGDIETKDPQAIKALIEAIKDRKGENDVLLRNEIAVALEKINPQSLDALNALIEKTKDEKYRVREASIQILGAINSQNNPEVLKAVMEGLKDENVWVESASAYALEKMKSQAQDLKAIKVLIQFLKDERFEVRRYSVKILGTLKHQNLEVIEALEKMSLEDESALVRKESEEALEKIHSHSSIFKQILNRARGAKKAFGSLLKRVHLNKAKRK